MPPVILWIVPINVSREMNVEKSRFNDIFETNQSVTTVKTKLTIEKYVDLLAPLKKPIIKCIRTKKPITPH
jgi:hypothetical protein